jgi:predicted nucleic acid-binding protein
MPSLGNADPVLPVIVDTSALLAFFDASEPDHEAVSAVLGAADALVVSPYVVAELNYLVATRHGVDDELVEDHVSLPTLDH